MWLNQFVRNVDHLKPAKRKKNIQIFLIKPLFPIKESVFLTRAKVFSALVPNLAIMNDGDDDSLCANGAHGGHHAPFHVGETFAFADAIPFLGHGHRPHHDQVDLWKD